ncbi:MAG: succinylglutamate desuccinylase/aspartoacylase family protein [Deltaproteobacteria bacterium]|nr:succinylglutamate desuccinylase/aspartoacylase family protein [Deltaproteobacteria bacterium]
MLFNKYIFFFTTSVLITFILMSICFCNFCFANQNLQFSFHKLESDKKGHTLLIIGGIQGDEPGGFNAASILATRYKITKGNLWIIPNLNFISIINRSRGVYGDLNRKFAGISPDDPDYNTIAEIKKVILNKKVDAVLNLHDGSGFYRKKYIDDMHNPLRWGQSIIIDQKIIDHPFGNLMETAKKAVKEINLKIKSKEERYSIHNTKTYNGNHEMSKTLTYFAIRNSKPAFGLEVSKSFLTYKRAYYHLLVMENFFKNFGVEFERDFELSFSGVKDAINKDIQICLNNKILLDLEDARKQLRYIPFRKDKKIELNSRNPLFALVEYQGKYQVFYGNRNITYIYPEYFEYDEQCADSINILIDGVEKKINFGKMIKVKKHFVVKPIKDSRVNIIGFVGEDKNKDEANILVRKNDFIKKFSVDKSGLIYRIEVYKEKKFSGMVLVKFII